MVLALHAQSLVLSLQTSDLSRVVRRRQRRLRCGAPRRRRRLSPSPTKLNPAPQNRISKAKFLGHRPDRAATRSDQIDCLPLVVVRKRPTLTSFHPTPPGSLRAYYRCPSIRRRFTSEVQKVFSPLA